MQIRTKDFNGKPLRTFSVTYSSDQDGYVIEMIDLESRVEVQAVFDKRQIMDLILGMAQQLPLIGEGVEAAPQEIEI